MPVLGLDTPLLSEFTGSFANDQLLSAATALSEDNWMEPSTPLIPGTPAAPTNPQLSTFLGTTSIVTGPNVPAEFVGCTRHTFLAGIKYDNKYLQRTFPQAFVPISDAKILAKNYLNTHSYDAVCFSSFCNETLVEMVTVANNSGQPAERGGHSECKFECLDPLTSEQVSDATKQTKRSSWTFIHRVSSNWYVDCAQLP